MRTISTALLSLLFLTLVFAENLSACSTFKLQKGDHLLYGHNLNEGDIGVPGLIFINKRGMFKKGRTWTELINKEDKNPSDFYWISRYGSVTFNTFGRDFPDGGMNEAGLYIWEMNENPEYPKNDSLPKLNQMNWMQYILDNCSTLDEALECAYQFEIDGWGWHYFIGDSKGNCAAVTFVDGKPLIHKNENMPVPGLFNEPYDREMEVLKYFKGFGGNYEPVLDDPEVPRFVKTAVMIQDFDPNTNAVDYGLYMLDKLQVDDLPEWSILFDVGNMDIYFKTRIHPKIKNFSMKDIDFSNKEPVKILDMDVEEGGDVRDQFSTYSNEKMKDFLENKIMTILPEEFFTCGGLSLDECIYNVSNHTDAALQKDNQFFTGVWKNRPESEDEMEIKLNINMKEEAVFGDAANSFEKEKGYTMDHLKLVGNDLIFTFKTKGGTLIEIQSIFKIDELTLQMFGTEYYYGSYVLYKQ